MSICINKNSVEYQTLKKRSGISDGILESICRDFIEKLGRFPYLDELYKSNSEPSLRQEFKIDSNNSTKIDLILSITGELTIEEANALINNLYRDLEVQITPLEKEAIIDITHRPTIYNFDNWTEEDEILAKASRDKNGNLLAPNGKPSNLTERQYVQVRTKAFKDWFGDWENNPKESSKVIDKNGEPLVVYHGSKNGNFDTFDDNYLRKADSGFFFTSDKEYAKQFGNTREFFLNIKNPNLTNIPLNIDTVETLLTVDHIRGTDGIQGHDDINTNENLSKSKGQEYVAIRPNQIKSATDNSGLFNRQNNNIYDPEPNGYLVLNNALQKLASLYGIKFNDITNAELNSEKWKGIISDPSSVNAFVYNGQIYINTDKANLDAPIHEMMHLFVGSIRFLNPKLYTNLINLSEQFPNYTKLVQQFKGRTRNDINEEIFIQEVSKYLVGMPSNISNLDSKIQYEISYNVKRLLDSILMGEDSVKTLSDDRLFNLSLNLIAKEIHSSITSNKFHGTMNVKNSELHRILNNIKSDLNNQGVLKEYCD